MIDVKHLRMEYGDTVAVENLSLQIPRGEVFGLIGPNGAGKTTLIRVLATLLEPTYGKVTIDGIDVLADPLRVHPLVGYMSDFFALYDQMRSWEYLDHFARCYGIARERRERLISEALELVSLDVRRDADIGSLSRGMRQRLCFAKSLLHEPQVLLLDEPASGLDPAGRVEFREMIKQLHAMGRTIVISSHILTEMTGFCTSIGILEQGKLLAAGSVSQILAKLQTHMRLDVDALGDPAALAAWLEQQPHIEQPVVAGSRVRCRWSAGRAELPALHRAAINAGFEIVSFAATEDNLEDIYMRISGHKTA